MGVREGDFNDKSRLKADIFVDIYFITYLHISSTKYN